jgi:2-C-methyl-D-erythritol 4-phosphate cytidylyltransferase/2-C-methyl-D-erythritol 2,4-cyclodiphosphate synthase
VHRLAPGGPLRIGGIDIPWERSLLGHSDADVVLHAVTDALLGAIAAGDIGTHFPDSDPQHRGADSAIFLQHAVRLVRDARGTIANVDVTVLAERPKLAPHLGAMRQRVADLVGLAAAQVSVKAKTVEGLGLIGRGDAIAAMAVVSVSMAS